MVTNWRVFSLINIYIVISIVHIIATVHKRLRKSLCWQYDFFQLILFVCGVFFCPLKRFFWLVRDLTCVLQCLSWTSHLIFKYACQNLLYLHLHYLLLSHWFFFHLFEISRYSTEKLNEAFSYLKIHARVTLIQHI